MSASKNLTGFRPSRKRGGGVNNGALNEYRIATATAPGIFKGDLVTVTLGTIFALENNTDKILGTFEGCRYVDANGDQKYSKNWPTGITATEAFALVNDDPAQTYIVQADAPVTIGDIGVLNFEVTLGAGSTTTGASAFGLDAASRGAGHDLPLRIIRILDEPGNEVGDAFTKVEVRIVQHFDAYISANPDATVA
jgi:hypothetical protein